MLVEGLEAPAGQESVRGTQRAAGEVSGDGTGVGGMGVEADADVGGGAGHEGRARFGPGPGMGRGPVVEVIGVLVQQQGRAAAEARQPGAAARHVRVDRRRA